MQTLSAYTPAQVGMELFHEKAGIRQPIVSLI